MQITLNNKIQEITADLTAMGLLEILFPNGINKGIAIAINQQVISKDKWSSYIINENDKVMIIKATQGG